MPRGRPRKTEVVQVVAPKRGRGRPRKVQPVIAQEKRVVPLGQVLCNRCKEVAVVNFPEYMMKLIPNQLICFDCATNARKTVDY
jgi:hypothetical protein